MKVHPTIPPDSPVDFETIKRVRMSDSHDVGLGEGWGLWHEGKLRYPQSS
jgi:hypothetical protein